MTAIPSGSARLARRLGMGSLVAAIVGPLAAHVGVVPPFVGFLTMALGLLLALVAAVAGLVALVRGPGPSRRAALRGFIPALVVLAVVLGNARSGGSYPRINDITTDTANPPQFVAAAALPANQGRDLAYPGATFADQQRAGYGDIAPLASKLPPDAAFALVQKAAHGIPTWEVTREDPSTHTLEAVDTSWLFRFQDDVVVEVRPEGTGSTIAMRSKSRVGKGDLGANAKRIAVFFTRVELQPGWQ